MGSSGPNSTARKGKGNSLARPNFSTDLKEWTGPAENTRNGRKEESDSQSKSVTGSELPCEIPTQRLTDRDSAPNTIVIVRWEEGANRHSCSAWERMGNEYRGSRLEDERTRCICENGYLKSTKRLNCKKRCVSHLMKVPPFPSSLCRGTGRSPIRVERNRCARMRFIRPTPL